MTRPTPHAPVAHASAAPLSRAVTGRPLTVLRVDGPARAELEREGVLAGTVVEIVGRTPLGGPLIVRVGRSRLALSGDVAAAVIAAPLQSDDGPR